VKTVDDLVRCLEAFVVLITASYERKEQAEFGALTRKFVWVFRHDRRLLLDLALEDKVSTIPFDGKIRRYWIEHIDAKYMVECLPMLVIIWGMDFDTGLGECLLKIGYDEPLPWDFTAMEDVNPTLLNKQAIDYAGKSYSKYRLIVHNLKRMYNYEFKEPFPVTCKTCGKAGYAESLFICSRCNEVFYCDITCQRKDWPVHKLICHTSV